MGSCERDRTRRSGIKQAYWQAKRWIIETSPIPSLTILANWRSARTWHMALSRRWAILACRQSIAQLRARDSHQKLKLLNDTSYDRGYVRSNMLPR